MGLDYLSVAKAFKHRYEAERQMEWFLPKNTQDCIELSKWINAQAKRDRRPVLDVGGQLMNAFFEDSRARQAGFPVSWLAKDPGRYFRSPDEDNGINKQEREEKSTQSYGEHLKAKRQLEYEHLMGVRRRNKARGWDGLSTDELVKKTMELIGRIGRAPTQRD